MQNTENVSKSQLNRKSILNLIYHHQPISQTEIRRISGIRVATVSEIVNELKKKGLITESGKLSSSGRGRKQSLIKINPEGRYFLGTELSSGKIETVAIDFEERIVAEKSLPFGNGTDKFKILEKISSGIKSLLKEKSLPRHKITGLGFVDPGVVDIEKGISIFSSILPNWRDVPTKEFLEKELGLPVSLIGTSQAKALAEQFFGSGKGVTDFIFIEYGEGISCGIVSEGSVIRGAVEMAGELGHFSFPDKKNLCHCGKRGCLETISGFSALTEEARVNIKKGVDSILNGKKKISPLMIFEGYKKGDRLCRTILDRAALYLGIAVANVANLLNPELVIFDKNLSLGGDKLLNRVQDITRKESLLGEKYLRFSLSSLGDKGGPLGGAALVLNQLLNYSGNNYTK